MPLNDKNFIVIPNITGSEGAVKVTICDATFQDRWDYSLQFPHPEFGSWLVEQLFSWKKVLGKKTGFPTKKYLCSSCNTELDPFLRTTSESKYEFEFMDFPPFLITIEMPSVVCPQCNKTCGIDLDGTLEYQLSEAIARAFESKDIRPGEGIQQVQCQFYTEDGIQCQNEALRNRKHCWKHDSRFVVTSSLVLIILACLCFFGLGFFAK